MTSLFKSKLKITSPTLPWQSMSKSLQICLEIYLIVDKIPQETVMNIVIHVLY